MNEEMQELPEEISRISDLIEKYIRHELAGEEKTELDDWLLESVENEKLFGDLVDEKELNKRLKHFHEVKGRTAGLKQRAIEMNFGEIKKVKRIGYNWKRWAVAAAVILFIVTGAYLFVNRKDNKVVAVEKVKSNVDKAPGKDGAILRLASGEEIVLDTAANGNVALQGNTAIVKNDSLLTYNTANQKKEKVLFNTLLTPRGRQFALVLPDGSKVWLNSASSIVFPTAFTGGIRKVEITGEAYFEVAHDKMKPFVVAANGTEVQVLGTHFNMNAYADEIAMKTTLLEGSVKVKKDNKEVVIKPGQQSAVAGSNITVLNNADVESAVAWKNGLIVFNGADIQTILRQISRWYNVDIEYKGVIKSPELFGKIPRTINLSEVLQALEMNSKLHFTINENKVIVQQ